MFSHNMIPDALCTYRFNRSYIYSALNTPPKKLQICIIFLLLNLILHSLYDRPNSRKWLFKKGKYIDICIEHKVQRIYLCEPDFL